MGGADLNPWIAKEDIDRKAREAALQAVSQVAVEPTSQVSYRSQGRLLEAVLKNNLFDYRQLAMVNLSMAIRIIFSAVVTRISKSFANRRKLPSQAIVLSTSQRFGITLN